MKIQIRKSVFETNSSSVHSLVMCSNDEFDAWKNGDYIYSYDCDKLVLATDNEYQDWKKRKDGGLMRDWELHDYLTYDDFFNSDWDTMPYETFEETHTTPSGDKVVAFGFYGHD